MPTLIYFCYSTAQFKLYSYMQFLGVLQRTMNRLFSLMYYLLHCTSRPITSPCQLTGLMANHLLLLSWCTVITRLCNANIGPLWIHVYVICNYSKSCHLCHPAPLLQLLPSSAPPHPTPPLSLTYISMLAKN